MRGLGRPWAFFEALLGHGCPGCGGRLDQPFLCSGCRAGLGPKKVRLFGEEAVYLGSYARLGGIARALKYGGRWGLAGLLAPPLAQGARGWPLEGVTWVPGFWHRTLRRGHHPPRLLAEAVARGLELPHAPLLVRARYAPSQVLGRRKALPLDAFRPSGKARGSWLLVDDVLTSGATFLRARSALLEAGVERVYGAFIALNEEALGPYLAYTGLGSG